MKASKKRVQKLEISETQFEEIKADFTREQATFQSEMDNLNKVLETAQTQLTREMEIRHRTERDIITAKQGTTVLTDVSECLMIFLPNFIATCTRLFL